MSRILLVDDSPHAQRMGERILSDEGYEVVTVSNSDSALIRLDDVDPDVVLADTVMPGRTGFEICQYLKMSPRHRHVRVILTAGVLEPLDEAQVKRSEADGTLRKPFEASALLAAVKPLAEAAAAARAEATNPGSGLKGQGPGQEMGPIVPFVAVVDAEQVRAAVTVALDASMSTMVDERARATRTAHPRAAAGSPFTTSIARRTGTADQSLEAPCHVHSGSGTRRHGAGGHCVGTADHPSGGTRGVPSPSFRAPVYVWRPDQAVWVAPGP
jgi:CheY-like chemotaxis protein